jgi:toxin FitB
MFLLDTNVVSEMRKLGDGRADPSVAVWLAGVEAQPLGFQRSP